MHLAEHTLDVPALPGSKELLGHLEAAVSARFSGAATPIRFVVTASSSGGYACEVGILSGVPAGLGGLVDSIFRFIRRPRRGGKDFNVALLVPTGIGAEIGGHAGDAGPVVRLLAGLCDLVVTHPNVVNASDINEIPDNGLYVEGSVLSRFLMGTVGLLPRASNRVLAVIDRHQDRQFVHVAVNTVNAARTTYGLSCPRVLELDPPIRMHAQYTGSGRAAGTVDGLERLCRYLAEHRDEYDAVAISSVINTPPGVHADYYFNKAGEMVNPWGGVEAMLTHALSCLFDVPSAHAPMFESLELANMDPGVVDPRMAAEAVSFAFFQCVLKGLHRSPALVTEAEDMKGTGVLTAADVAAVVIPDGCLGLPTLAALEQGIPLIAVRENRNLLRNDLGALPWRPGQFFRVENYWEAAGVLAALKAGVAPEAVRRPIRSVEWTTLAETATASEPTDGAGAVAAGGLLEPAIGAIG